MKKQEFLDKLRKGLSALPQNDINEHLTFYGEMIDDRIEDGKDEETAVLEIGSVDEVVSQIVSQIPLLKLFKEKIKPKRKLSVWEIVLLALGSPIWLSLLITALAVVLVIYVCVWVVIAVLWSAFAALAVCGFSGVIGGIIIFAKGNIPTGIALIGAGALCAGLSIFMFFGCVFVTKHISLLTKKLLIRIKNRIVKKEESK